MIFLLLIIRFIRFINFAYLVSSSDIYPSVVSDSELEKMGVSRHHLHSHHKKPKPSSGFHYQPEPEDLPNGIIYHHKGFHDHGDVLDARGVDYMRNIEERMRAAGKYDELMKFAQQEHEIHKGHVVKNFEEESHYWAQWAKDVLEGAEAEKLIANAYKRPPVEKFKQAVSYPRKPSPGMGLYWAEETTVTKEITTTTEGPDDSTVKISNHEILEIALKRLSDIQSRETSPPPPATTTTEPPETYLPPGFDASDLKVQKEARRAQAPVANQQQQAYYNNGWNYGNQNYWGNNGYGYNTNQQQWYPRNGYSYGQNYNYQPQGYYQQQQLQHKNQAMPGNQQSNGNQQVYTDQVPQVEGYSYGQNYNYQPQGYNHQQQLQQRNQAMAGERPSNENQQVVANQIPKAETQTAILQKQTKQLEQDALELIGRGTTKQPTQKNNSTTTAYLPNMSTSSKHPTRSDDKKKLKDLREMAKEMMSKGYMLPPLQHHANNMLAPDNVPEQFAGSIGGSNDGMTYVPPTIVEKARSAPMKDDFHSPIKWVKTDSNETKDGLAKVTDDKTGANLEIVINGTIFVPVIDYDPARLGITTTTQYTPPVTVRQNTAGERAVLRTITENFEAKTIDERDWLAIEIILGKTDGTSQCEGSGCAARCNKKQCQSGCYGDTCSSGCAADFCSSACNGPGCFAMCVGERCASRCENEGCDARCRGKDCKAECRGLGCYFTINGVLSMNQYSGFVEETIPQTKGDQNIFS